MDVKTGLIILGECAMFGAVIWCFQKEKALMAFERAAARKIRYIRRKKAAAKEIKRRQKINARAAYRPVKPPKKKNEEKAA